MDQYIKADILNQASDWEQYNLPYWIRNFFTGNASNAYQELYVSNGSVYLHNKVFNLGSAQRVGQTFLVYQSDFEKQPQKSEIAYAKGILEAIWGFNFESIAHPTQTNSTLFYCFALYEVTRSSSLLSHDIAKAIHPTDCFLEKLISESQRGTDPLLTPLPYMHRLPYVKTSWLPDKLDSFTQHITFEKSIACRLTELDFAENKSASSFYINLNPNLFLKNMRDSFLMYKTSDYPPILAFEKIVHRDVFLKEVLVFRGGVCYLWNLKILSTLRLESRESIDDQHLDVQQISTLSLTKISWYLKIFYNLNLLVEQIESTLVDIALESSKKTAVLSQIGSDKIDKASQFLTIYFSMPGGILEKFQDGLESMSFEGISFRDAQKFLVQFGHFSFLKDDFKMSNLLKSYVFDLNGDSIAIVQKSKRWVFTRNGKICNTNPFQEKENLASFDDIEIFSRNVLKNIEKSKGKDKE